MPPWRANKLCTVMTLLLLLGGDRATRRSKFMGTAAGVKGGASSGADAAATAEALFSPAAAAAAAPLLVCMDGGDISGDERGKARSTGSGRSDATRGSTCAALEALAPLTRLPSL